MKRIEKLEQMKSDPYWGDKLRKLSKQELDLLEAFIRDNEEVDYSLFTQFVNRMYLSTYGYPETKNAGLVQDILSSLARTALGHYGYHGTKRWIHPSQRHLHGGKEYEIVDETAKAKKEDI
jgi:hypothetical protein